MTQPTQRQVDDGLAKSMHLFTRAKIGEAAQIDPQRPQRILTALDGSSQDHAAALLARQLTERLGCQTAYLFVPASEGQTPHPSAVDELEAVSAALLTADAPHNYEQILAASEQFNADLLIVPCPFGRDFDSVGEDSTGTVIDVLTARSTASLIAIRRAEAVGRDPTCHLRLILTGENPAAEAAARWAVGLTPSGGRLELLLLVEASFYENFREAFESISPDVEVSYEDLENALARTYGQLHAGLQRAASEHDFAYELLIRHEGDEQPITPADPVAQPALMVLAMQRSNRDSQGEVQEFIRRSPHPVFVATIE